MLYPSLRGGNSNPGQIEAFFGEVDDVLAATEFVAQLPYVDPQRIYLGGHSTGGTLALLVAAASDRYRAVFSFGPVDDVAGYGADVLPFNPFDQREVVLRSPIYWLDRIKTPVFVKSRGQTKNHSGSSPPAPSGNTSLRKIAASRIAPLVPACTTTSANRSLR